MENTTCRKAPNSAVEGKATAQWNLNFFFCLQIMHAFTNIKKGVRFVLFDHSVEGYDSWPEQCGVCRPQSSVIVRIRP